MPLRLSSPSGHNQNAGAILAATAARVMIGITSLLDKMQGGDSKITFEQLYRFAPYKPHQVR